MNLRRLVLLAHVIAGADRVGANDDEIEIPLDDGRAEFPPTDTGVGEESPTRHDQQIHVMYAEFQTSNVSEIMLSKHSPMYRDECNDSDSTPLAPRKRMHGFEERMSSLSMANGTNNDTRATLVSVQHNNNFVNVSARQRQRDKAAFVSFLLVLAIGFTVAIYAVYGKF